jgi:DNA ligase (NAD+)
VRGEIYMKLSVFARYKAAGKANPRNLAAGAIKQKDAERSAAYQLSFAAYDVPNSTRATLAEDLEDLARWGFAPLQYVVVERENLGAGYTHFGEQRAALDYEIDGVVYKANAHTERTRLGVTSHHPSYAIAYKFQGDSGTSVLQDIEWSVARTGTITPVAIVDPVSLSGVSVSRASLHNVAFIDKLGLTLGATVTLIRRGGVIPNVEFVNTPGALPVVIPGRCPSCGEPVVRERDFLYCTKPATCKRAVLGQLAHFASAIEVLGFGESLLEQAYDAGLLRTPGDFFRLTTEALAGLTKVDKDGKLRTIKGGASAVLGVTVASKVVAELAKKRSLDLATFLRALGLAEIGKTVSKLLADKYGNLDAVLAAEEAELAAVHGVGDVIAQSVVSGLAGARPVIADLVSQITLTYERKTGGEGPLKGQSFVFTGKMVAFARSEGEKRVREAGGEVLSAVNKSLTYLVLGDDKTGPKSAKEKAADKLLSQGATLRVLAEAEFLALLPA